MIKKLYGAYHMGGFSCCQINSPSGEKYKITLFFFTSNISHQTLHETILI